ncbi:hypothetical protein QN277_014323 [Acacia crassicarpa]|uniref:Uncharacterized protein n=1 Tax=Acacia crassicarpa TaxID=499986 RepID=A0AAE1IPA6_9FABA|nr:hypothetical protein QN277_014323 [Acacia crassicarpa]
MASSSTRLLVIALFIAVSFCSICRVEAIGNRKLLAPSIPNFPPFPPITEWPEYRLPPPFFKFPNTQFFPNVPFFSPPASTTTTP